MYKISALFERAKIRALAISDFVVRVAMRIATNLDCHLIRTASHPVSILHSQTGSLNGPLALVHTLYVMLAGILADLAEFLSRNNTLTRTRKTCVVCTVFLFSSTRRSLIKPLRGEH